MKAQLSIEFMVYVAAGTASLVLVLAAAGPSFNSIGSINANSYMSALVAEINANMAYTRSVFNAYIPAGICNASINATSIAYMGRRYYFTNALSMNQNICKYAGAMHTIEILQAENSSFTMRVVK